ncbi:MAG: hypothetical protein IPM82_20480 [Saprospiraceae bacterium]|nr:hypothetical protein [Saprospiraceae bacterium]
MSQTENAGQTQVAINGAFATWLATASGTGGCNGVLTNNSVAQGGPPPATGGSTTVTFTYAQSPPSTLPMEWGLPVLDADLPGDLHGGIGTTRRAHLPGEHDDRRLSDAG